MDKIEIKQGTTFEVKSTQIRDEEGAVIPLTGYTFTAEIRDLKGQKVKTLAISVDVSDNSISSTPTETSSMPLGLLICDIKMEKEGVIEYTPTFQLEIVSKVTK
jgi:hypothetical protein